MSSKISALTEVLPVNLTTGDCVPFARGVSQPNWKLDLSKLGTTYRLTGCDPTGVADCNSSIASGNINTQLNALSAAGGGFAALYAGTFRCTAAVLVPNNVQLIGQGIGVTTLLFPVGTILSPVGAGVVGFEGVDNSSATQMTINLTAVTGTGVDGIVFVPLTNTTTLSNRITFGTASVTPYQLGETVAGSVSGATGTIIVYDTVGLRMSLYSVKGTFQSGENIVGQSSGATLVSTSGILNKASTRCAAKSVEVLGRAFQNNQYLVWNRMGHDIEVSSCVVNGNSIIDNGLFAFDSVQSHQVGIEGLGAYNYLIFNNTVKYAADDGILLGQPNGGISIPNENCSVVLNTVVSCGTSIHLDAASSLGVPLSLKNSVIMQNKVVSPWKYGLNVGGVGWGVGEVAYSGVIIDSNSFDLTGSKRAATYGSFAAYMNIGTGVSNTGCSLTNNSFVSGGGKGASTIFYGGSIISNAEGWTISGNTFDRVVNADTPANVSLRGANDTIFKNNRVSRPGKSLFSVATSLRCQFSNNNFLGAPSLGSAFCSTWSGDCSGTVFTDNYMDCGSNPNAGGLVGQSATGTNWMMQDNICINGVLLSTASGLPYVPSTTTTQTNNFGTFAPTTGTSFTVTISSGKVIPLSRILVTQTAGVPKAITVTNGAAGSNQFTVTSGTAFAAPDAFTWSITN